MQEFFYCQMGAGQTIRRSHLMFNGYRLPDICNIRGVAGLWRKDVCSRLDVWKPRYYSAGKRRKVIPKFTCTRKECARSSHIGWKPSIQVVWLKLSPSAKSAMVKTWQRPHIRVLQNTHHYTDGKKHTRSQRLPLYLEALNIRV